MTFLFPGKFEMDVGDGNLNILWGGGGFSWQNVRSNLR
jgi:hypothetical protein